MNKPTITKYIEPNNIWDMSVGATVPIGLLTECNAGWRSKRPVIYHDKCVRCLKCFIFCPDGVVDISAEQLQIDYDFCKGCGICAYECKAGAIVMTKEEG